MEKDSADKANTELENSVTNEEQGSDVEKKVNNGKVISEEKKEESAIKLTNELPKKENASEEEAEPTTPIINENPETVDADPPAEPVKDTKPEKTPSDKEAVSLDTEPKPEETTVKEIVGSTINDPELLLLEHSEKAVKDIDEDTNTTTGGEQDDIKDVDFNTYSREELVEVIKKLGKEEDPFKADNILQKIAPVFNKLRDEARQNALKKFIDEGGVEDDFHYKPDELSLRFDANYKLIKDKKSKKFKEQDKERSKNLLLAEEILAELREFVDSKESSGSFNQFKSIQQKWKDLGDVPSQNSRTLWASYNALIHLFYDQRSIYFELKELDRKKNYEAKLQLCEKAEALDKVSNIREAIKTLNDLHHEFKHMGPVPEEVQEDLWQRFKAASDKVYEKRKVFVQELKAELQENLVKKEALAEEIQKFASFNSDRIKEWNNKTKDLINLQKAWEAIGGLPKDKAKQINKIFWLSFKKFFSNKHQFFKQLEADRTVNLEKKQKLVDQANTLKDSEEWEKTANELKKIQSQWREIGPVPEKMRKKLYEEFKGACDQFFENKRAGQKSNQEQFKENLKAKQEVIKQIISLKNDADNNVEKFNTLRKQFLEIGYVPKKNIGTVKQEFQAAIEDFLGSVNSLNIKEKEAIMLEAEFSGLAGSEHSEKELYHKEQAVRRHINKLEDDIALWQNNLEFFANTKSTDKLRKDVNKKIDEASNQVEGLRRQLKMLRSM